MVSTMKGVDPNRLILPIAVIVLAVLAITANYRLEIGATGLKFENNNAFAVRVTQYPSQ
jgi:hypothetical protein